MYQRQVLLCIYSNEDKCLPSRKSGVWSIGCEKMDQADRQELEALLDAYMHAIEGGQAPELAGE